MMEIFSSIKLDKKLGEPMYLQLYYQIKNIIEEGILPPGFKLPSIRQLSDVLDVNQVTVVSAYKLLVNNKYAYSKSGSGIYISDLLPSNEGTENDGNDVITDELYQQDDLLFISKGLIKINESTINLASATPTPDLFPVDKFKLVLNEVLDRDLGLAFSYQESQGYPPLRESIVESLCPDMSGCSYKNIQIISGAQQGIDIIAKAFLKQGDYVITEAPTYTGAVAVFKSRGARILDVEMQEDGPNLNIIEHYLKKYRPKLIYCIPSFQNPTGYSLSNYKRKELIKLVEKYNSYIIEDDYVSELDYENKAYIPLKKLDSNGRVIFIKSFSKIFMPGLRLGFMVVPQNLKAGILEAKHTTDISTSGLIQRAFDLYIRKGFWSHHLEYVYRTYKERYCKVINMLDKYLPHGVQYYKPGGGLNIWLTFPCSFSVERLFKECANSNIVFAPGRIFFSSIPSQKNGSLRLSFAATYTGQIEPGIQKFCSIVQNLLNHDAHIYENIPIL